MTTRSLGTVMAGAALFSLLLQAGHAPAADPVVAAAGDIACDPADASFNGGVGTAAFCRMKATSDLLVGAGLDAVLALGDTQYEDGALSKFTASYDPSWGRVKSITRPAPGNHEYGTAGAAGYFAYFGAAADPDAHGGYYSFDLGDDGRGHPTWHLIALNSSCGAVGGCGSTSPQALWLAADLAAHPGVCTLAYWHQPRFSSGTHGDDATYGAFWDLLYDAGVDLVLNGHDHDYERFAPLTPGAATDPARGVREFVVGTGGKNQTAFGTVRAGSEVRSNGAFGVLRLTLHPASYDWALMAAGSAFTDTGSAPCHGTPRPTRFFTLPPCRAVDTRDPTGPSGGPALGAGGARRFPLTGACGVPAEAISVSVNVTVTGATADGDLRLYAAGQTVPGASTINFTAGRTRANNAVVKIGSYGELSVLCEMPDPAGSAHVVLDVAGYYR